MGVYNAAAWFRRRERHLAVNAVLYAALTLWERQHVSHHLAECRRRREVEAGTTPVLPKSMPTSTDVAA